MIDERINTNLKSCTPYSTVQENKMGKTLLAQ